MTIQETPTGTSYPFHPLADLFPLLEGEEFAALLDDIQAHGVLEPVWLYEGHILDGRNRYRACAFLGRECPTRVFEGDDPVGLVVSMNLRRRHLDESQRAMVAARLANRPEGRPKTGEISTVSQAQAAQLFHVSRETVVAAKKVLHEGAPEIVQAVDTGALAVSAAVPLTTLSHELQPVALAAAQRDAPGKKPTAKQTRAVVHRTQVVATVQEHMAAGKTPPEAVEHALTLHDIPLPPPALVEALYEATGGQVTLTIPDGALPEGHTTDAEAIPDALPKRLVQLVDLLEALANVQELEPLLRDMPPEWYDRVDQSLDPAFDTLRRLRTLWKQHRQHEASEVSVRPKQSQHGKHPPKGRTRRTTTRSQPALLLKTIRTASQPLTCEALRQMPGVDRSRLTRNVDRLVAQGKIQETPQGYVVVSP